MQAKSSKLAKPEDYDNTNFIIREAELADEKRKRDEAKKKKFYDEFKPDFDLDEVPPLEWINQTSNMKWNLFWLVLDKYFW